MRMCAARRVGLLRVPRVRRRSVAFAAIMTVDAARAEIFEFENLDGDRDAAAPGPAQDNTKRYYSPRIATNMASGGIAR
jgi:hypothetical protein